MHLHPALIRKSSREGGEMVSVYPGTHVICRQPCGFNQSLDPMQAHSQDLEQEGGWNLLEARCSTRLRLYARRFVQEKTSLMLSLS